VFGEKAARNHVDRMYAMTGVSNRIGASMYALELGLVGRPRGDRLIRRPLGADEYKPCSR
jgi:hypothetical protein